MCPTRYIAMQEMQKCKMKLILSNCKTKRFVTTQKSKTIYIERNKIHRPLPDFLKASYYESKYLTCQYKQMFGTFVEIILT